MASNKAKKRKKIRRVNIGTKCLYGGVLLVFLALINDIEKMAAKSSADALFILGGAMLFSLITIARRYS